MYLRYILRWRSGSRVRRDEGEAGGLGGAPTFAPRGALETADLGRRPLVAPPADSRGGGCQPGRGEGAGARLGRGHRLLGAHVQVVHATIVKNFLTNITCELGTMAGGGRRLFLPHYG